MLDCNSLALPITEFQLWVLGQDLTYAKGGVVVMCEFADKHDAIIVARTAAGKEYFVFRASYAYFAGQLRLFCMTVH